MKQEEEEEVEEKKKKTAFCLENKFHSINLLQN